MLAPEHVHEATMPPTRLTAEQIETLHAEFRRTGSVTAAAKAASTTRLTARRRLAALRSTPANAQSAAGPDGYVACGATTRDGAPCTRPALASGACELHDPSAAAERGRAGRAKQLASARAEREAIAEAVRVGDVGQVRELLELAARGAVVDRRWSDAVAAARVALTAIDTADVAARLDALETRLREGGL